MTCELKVTASTRIDGASCVVRHVNAQLMKVQERLVTLGTYMLLLLVLLRHVQPASSTEQHHYQSQRS